MVATVAAQLAGSVRTESDREQASADIGPIEFAEYTEGEVAVEPPAPELISFKELIADPDPAATLVSAPEWFQRKRRVPKIRPIKRTQSAEPEEWSIRSALVWLRSSAGSASSISLLMHASVLVALSWIAFAGHRETKPFTTIISESETEIGSVSFSGVADLSEVLRGGSSNLSAALTELTPESLGPVFSPELSSNAAQLAGQGTEGTGQGFGNDTGDGFEDGAGFLFKMPKSGKAVQKGNFAAWTVPPDPMPGENYMIVIRMKMPPQSKPLRVSDLSGSVTGTDQFQLLIPFDRRQLDATVTERKGIVVPVKATDFLPIVDGHVQVMVRVPGAARLVRDTIEIRSKLLNEAQRLEIVF